MFSLRRAAFRALTSQPTRQLSTLRSAQPLNRQWTPQRSSVRCFTQQIRLRADEAERKEEASPAEATTSGETVSTEPSQAEKDVESGDAAPQAADLANASPAAALAEGGNVAAPADAVSEASGSTAEPLQSSQPEQQQEPSYTQQAAGVASNAASSAAQTARSAVDTVTRGQREVGFESRGPAPTGDGRIHPSKILYVGNLFFSVTAPQLEAEFAKYGALTNSRIVTDSRGLSKGFAYIEFENLDAAERAVRELDQKVFQGRRMAVQYHVRREPRMAQRIQRDPAPPSKTLFIGNMSYQMSDRDLNDLFREVRNVLDVRVAIDRRSGQPRGFAHADFVDVASAERAKEVLEKKVVYGRTLRVDYSASSTQTRSVE